MRLEVLLFLGRLKSMKMERFCQNYAKSGNATQSFMNAGYKYKDYTNAGIGSCKLLKNPNIQRRLQELTGEAIKKQHDNAIADIQEMQSILTKIIREELDEEVLNVVGDGEGYSHVTSNRKKASIADRIRAIEKLAKMQGAFTEKVEVSGNVPIVISGDEELQD